MLIVISLPGIDELEPSDAGMINYLIFEHLGIAASVKGTIDPEFEGRVPYLTGTVEG